MKPIRYEVEIEGHATPFKWRVFQMGGKPDIRKRVRNGTAETYDDALTTAREAARDAEFDRLHEATVEKVPLYVVSDEGNLVAAELAELESWPVMDEEPGEKTPHPFEPPEMERA